MKISSQILKFFGPIAINYTKRTPHKLFIVIATAMKYVLNKIRPGLKSLVILKIDMMNLKGVNSKISGDRG